MSLLRILPDNPVSFQNPVEVATQGRLALAFFAAIHCNQTGSGHHRVAWARTRNQEVWT